MVVAALMAICHIKVPSAMGRRSRRGLRTSRSATAGPFPPLCIVPIPPPVARLRRGRSVELCGENPYKDARAHPSRGPVGFPSHGPRLLISRTRRSRFHEQPFPAREQRNPHLPPLSANRATEVEKAALDAPISEALTDLRLSGQSMHWATELVVLDRPPCPFTGPIPTL